MHLICYIFILQKKIRLKRSVEELQATYPHRKDLVDVASEFKRLYVLSDPKENSPRSDELGSTRLAHDTLAPLIRQRFSTSSTPGQRAQRILQNKAPDWNNGETSTTLDERDLFLVETGAGGMRGRNDEESKLIEESRKVRDKKQANRRCLWRVGIAALCLIVLGAGVSVWQWRDAEKAKREAERQRDLALSNSLIKQARDIESLRPDQALLLYKEASVRVSNPNTDSTASKDLNNYTSTVNFPKQLQHIVHAHGVNNTKEPRVADLAFSPTNSILASAGLDGEIFLWDITNKHLTNRRELTNQNNPSHGSDGSQDVDRLAFNPSGNYLASGGRDNWVILWDITKGTGEACEADTQNTTPEDYVTAVAFNETSTLVASGHHSGEIRLWSITDSNCRLSVKKSFKDIHKLLPQPMDSRVNVEKVLNVIFDKNNLWVIFSGGLIVSLDVTTTDLDVSLRCKAISNEDRYSSAFYESNSQSIFLATTTGKVFYFPISSSDCDKSDWKLATDEAAGEIFDIAFSQPQRRFVFGRQENDTLDVFGYPEENGSNLIDISPKGLTQAIYSVAFDKDGIDGIFFASGDSAGNISLWKLDQKDLDQTLQERACDLAGRNFSQAEWDQYLGSDTPYHCTCSNFPPGEGIEIKTLSDSSQCKIN